MRRMAGQLPLAVRRGLGRASDLLAELLHVETGPTRAAHGLAPRQRQNQFQRLRALVRI